LERRFFVKKLIVILLPLVFMFSCSLGMLDKYTDTGDIEVPNDKGAVRLTLPGGQGKAATQADVQSYRVVLSGIDVAYNNSIIGLPGQTILFEKLTPGDYTVTVDAYDGADPDAAASNRIFTGSTNVTVVAGQVSKATVQLQYVDGDVEIEIIFPEAPGGGQPAGKEELDQSQTEINNSTNASSYYPAGQVFTAGITGDLTRIELYLCADNAAPPPDQIVWLILHDGEDFYSPEVGTSTSIPLQLTMPDWVTFEFNDVAIIAGHKYTIEICSNHGLRVYEYDGTNGDIYTGGYAIWYSVPQIWDFAFRTYVYH
jgi:hypothetical protein